MTARPKPFLVGIAGGTGSGKSTLARGLRDAFPDRVTTVHLDDYFYPPEHAPRFKGMLNYEHPDSIDGERLAYDLAELKAGKTVVINAKDQHAKAEYGTANPRELTEFAPKPLVLVEGFLTLGIPAVRRLLDLKIYLDAPFDLHLGRRIHFMVDGYADTVLKPMHERYVAASRRYADDVVDVERLSAAEVLAEVKTRLPERLTG